ncbi:MAG: hypothetical protein CMJ91_09935, partial [Planctomycetes bacterium]|nr:hypothetical protein [Planctomycetota bacterium]
MPVLRKPLLLLILLVPCAVRAAELGPLVREYTEALKKVTGPLNQRPGLVVIHVVPVLEKIGVLSTTASERWLAAELDNARTASYVRETIPRVLLAGPGKDVASILLQGLGKRPPGVREACLRALAESEGSLGLAESKLLLQQLGAKASRPGDAGAAQRLELTIGVFRKITDGAVRTWLGGEAYSSAGGKTDRLYVLARLAAELKLEGARAELVRLVGHRSRELAITAIEALAEIGVGDAFEEIGAALDRPGVDVRLRARALDALVASEKGIEFAIEAASGKDPELRAVAMGSLALRAADPRAMKILLGGLEDSDASVRNVALRSLRQVRVKSMIGALIKVVGSHPDESFKVRALELLVNASGQNFGLAAVDWKKWWAQSE